MALWAQLTVSFRENRVTVKREMPSPASNLATLSSVMENKGGYLGSRDHGLEAGEGEEKALVSKFLRLIYFKANEIML